MFQIKGPKHLPQLEDLILSISNILPLGNYSRHTIYPSCFGLLHCSDTVSRMSSSYGTSQGAGCFMRTTGSGGIEGLSHHFFSNFDMHANPTRILLKCKFWFSSFRMGLPSWLHGNNSTCQRRRCRRRGFSPWVGKIPWRRAWQLTPVFFPGESHGQRSLVGCSPWGCKELDMTEPLSTHAHQSRVAPKMLPF